MIFGANIHAIWLFPDFLISTVIRSKFQVVNALVYVANSFSFFTMTIISTEQLMWVM